MNIAILIGISDYEKQPKLPACRADLDAMDSLLKSTAKYDNVHVFDDSLVSTELKDAIAQVIDELVESETDVEEVFFYYTGHGLFDGEEFYYPLKDFDRNKLSQTSLSNSDVDRWLKSLAPELAVKVIDACESGIQYIKATDGVDLEKYVQETKSGFRKCVFMFSSQHNQSSFQDDQQSFFTRYFLEAVKTHDGDRIRYGYIIDYITDKFEGNPRQKPYFVQQGTNTELFSTLTADINELKSLLELATSAEDKQLSLKELVEEEAKKYFSEEQVLALLSEIRQVVESFSFPPILQDLYEITLEFPASGRSVANAATIGEKLRSEELPYFARPTEREVKQDPSDRLYLMKETLFPRYEIDGYTYTFNAPYEAIVVQLLPKQPILNEYYCGVVLLFSNIEMRIAHFFTYAKRINWTRSRLKTKIYWREIDLFLIEKERILKNINQILSDLSQYIQDDLAQRFQKD